MTLKNHPEMLEEIENAVREHYGLPVSERAKEDIPSEVKKEEEKKTRTKTKDKAEE